jgi:hypothetical protein
MNGTVVKSFAKSCGPSSEKEWVEVVDAGIVVDVDRVGAGRE